ncbi:MAG TPA: phosphoglycolate phosphatase [Gammaproteobacteria bacterium]|nr:phosphoglycolate phosphatase [Gammaproteobacteria bacterium]
MIRTLLLDLDGTLADTAPDLAAALNRTLEEAGRSALPFERIRPVVSHGGRALLRLGFGLTGDEPEYAAVRERFLGHYQRDIALHTRLFPGMAELLAAVEANGMNWGVVTNKPAWLTDPLLAALGLNERAATVVSGDTLAVNKPDPAPMLHACREAGSGPGECLYLGDAERDVQAGRNAGMRTLVALFGYLADEDDPAGWGADGLVNEPGEVLAWIDRFAA